MCNVKDERPFYNMGFVKSMLRNRLTTHLDLVVVAMSSLIVAKSCHGAKT